MKRSLLLALLSLASAANLYSLDRYAFTITSYRLNAQVDRQSHVFAVIYGRLVLRNDSKTPQKNLSLQISSSLQWNDIGTDDDPLDCNCFAQPKRKLQWLGATYTSDIDHTGSLSEAIVTLEKPVPPGGEVAVDVQYGGKITADAGRLTRIGLPEQLALHSDWDQISEAFTAVRGLGYVVWYPVSIEAVSLSDGNAVSDAIAVWKERHRRSEFLVDLGVLSPIKSPTECFASNARSEKGGGWSLTGKTFDGGQTQQDAAQEQQVLHGVTLEAHGLQNTTPAFAIFSSCDGLSRPAVDITFTPDHSLIAKDYATAAEASQPLLDSWAPEAQNRPIHVIELSEPEASPYQDGASLFTPLVSATQQNLQLLLLPSQVAARFVTPRPWMQKGLGLFAQAIYNREHGGRDAALKFLDQYEAPLAKAEELARVGDPASKNPARKSDSDNTLLNTTDELYLRVKAGFVFWMLQDMLGDAALQHALAAYRSDADREPTYFQKILETQTRHDLEWFFDDWVYRDRGLPDFHVTTAYSRKLLSSSGEGNQYQVTATIENSGSAGAEVPVRIETAKGEKVVRVLVRAHDKGYARVEVPEPATRVIVNDGSVPESNTGNNVYEFSAKPQS